MAKRTIYCRHGKRFVDLIFSFVLLVIFLPVGSITALVIWLKLGSPILFRQVRPGLNGQPFTLLKFRTMIEGRDAHGNSLPDTERLTGFGAFLRSTSIDELPQLINVLTGTMSIVGPRPLLMEYLPRYSSRQIRRHEVRPGITGLSQVNGRNRLSWEEKFEMDVWYVDNVSLPLDLKILGRTLFRVVGRQGVTPADRPTVDYFRGTIDTPNHDGKTAVRRDNSISSK